MLNFKNIFKEKVISVFMEKSKSRQITFFIPEDLFKEFSKKCIDENTTKTDVLIEKIKDFLKKK